MGYAQFHALITAVLLAGHDASEIPEWRDEVVVSKMAARATEVMDECGFVQKKVTR